MKSFVHLITLAILSFLTFSIQAKESFTLSLNATESKCFPVRLSTTPGYINLNLALFKGQSRADDDYPDVAVFLARRDAIHYKKKYYNSNGTSYKICTMEAIKDGYCTHQSLGKYLYELSDPFAVATPDNIYDEILWQVGTYEAVFEFKESGYYCIFSYSEVAEDYALDVEIIDGYGLTNDQRVKLTVSNLELLLNGLFFIGFSTSWNFWINAKLNEIPFVVRCILVSTSANLLVKSLVKLDLQYLNGSSALLSKSVEIFSQLYSLALLLCLYHFTFDFSYSFNRELSKDIEGLFYFALSALTTILKVFFPSVSFLSKSKGLIESFIIIIILVRYRLIAEDYSYSLALSPIKYSQFKSLILSTIFTEYAFPLIFLNPVSMKAFNKFIFPQLSPLITYYVPSLTNPLLDSSLEKLYGDLELPVLVSGIRLLISFYNILTSWNPSLVNSAIKLDETLMKVNAAKSE